MRWPVFPGFYMIFEKKKKKRKTREIFLAIFGRFSIIFYIVDPGILILIFQISILLQQGILEARFWAPNSTFHFSIFRTFDRKFERSTKKWPRINKGLPQNSPFVSQYIIFFAPWGDLGGATPLLIRARG